MNGIFEVEDFISDDGSRLVVVALESSLGKRSNDASAFVVHVFADVNVLFLVLRRSEKIH